jgi:hypothetical protein
MVSQDEVNWRKPTKEQNSKSTAFIHSVSLRDGCSIIRHE